VTGSPWTVIISKRCRPGDTTLESWRRTAPDTLVTSTQTGRFHGITAVAYQAYAKKPEPHVPVKTRGPRLFAQEKVVGVSIGEPP